MMRARNHALVLVLPLAALLTACAPAPEKAPPAATPAVDTAAVIAAIDALWARWIVADTADDVDAILALSAEDARFDLKGAPPMIGRDGARAIMLPLYRQIDYLEASSSPSTTIAISNELAHQWGAYRERYTMKRTAGEMTDHGRYAAAFVKERDGQWRFAYMMAMVDSTTTKK